MMKVFVRCLLAVGMHHHGQQQLTIDEPLYLKHEPTNKYDKNAIAIYNMNDRKVAYLSRQDASCVATLLRQEIPEDMKIFAKAKYPAETRSQRQGPSQRIGLGFRSDKAHVEKIKEIFSFTGASIETI